MNIPGKIILQDVYFDSGEKKVVLSGSNTYLLKEPVWGEETISLGPKNLWERFFPKYFPSETKIEKRRPEKDIKFQGKKNIFGREVNIFEVTDLWASSVVPLKGSLLVATDNMKLYDLFKNGSFLKMEPGFSAQAYLEFLGFGGEIFYASLTESTMKGMFGHRFLIFDSDFNEIHSSERVINTYVSSPKRFFVNFEVDLKFNNDWEAWENGKLVQKIKTIPYDPEDPMDLEVHFTDGKNLYQAMDGEVWLLSEDNPVKILEIDNKWSPVMATDGEYATISDHKNLFLIKDGTMVAKGEVEHDEPLYNLVINGSSIFAVANKKIQQYKVF